MDAIKIECENSWATVLPQGGLVSAAVIQGVKVLFPDQIIETPSGLKRRGGIPLLFPNAGAYNATDQYGLSQHGFARECLWTIYEQTARSVSLTLFENKNTLTQYPFNFTLLYTVQIEKNSLACSLNVKNTGTAPLPVALGFHPYFYVDSNVKNNITTSITGFNSGQALWPETLSFPHSSVIAFTSPNQNTTYIESSVYFKNTMIWSEVGMDYICIEPWVGEVGALQDPGQRMQILAGENATYNMVIRQDS